MNCQAVFSNSPNDKYARCKLQVTTYSLELTAMIFLLRHGETANQREKSFIGQTDLRLSETGRRQAHQWRDALELVSFGRIWCSDLLRSRETAQIIAESGRTRVEIMPELGEIHLGDWEGLPMAEVRSRFPEEWRKRGQDMASYRPSRGESFADLHARVIPVFERIMSLRQGDTLIVAHAGVNRVILCHILGMPLDHIFRLGQDYAALNTIDCKKEPPRVIFMNMPLRTYFSVNRNTPSHFSPRATGGQIIVTEVLQHREAHVLGFGKEDVKTDGLCPIGPEKSDQFSMN